MVSFVIVMRLLGSLAVAGRALLFTIAVDLGLADYDHSAAKSFGVS